MHKLFRRAAGWVLAAAVLAGAGMYALRRALPDTFTVQPGQTLAIASMPWLSAQPGRAASGEVPASAGRRRRQPDPDAGAV